MRLMPDVYLVGSGRNGLCISDEFDCHVYLLDGGDELALIDAGVGIDTDAIVANIRADGLDPGRIRHVILTHGHSDHAGGARDFHDRFGAAVYIHQREANWVRNGDEEANGLHIAKTVGYYPQDYRFQPCPVERELRDGDRVQVGRYAVAALHTPGHSPGHCSLLAEVAGKRVLFCGDVVQFGDAGQFKGMISLLSAPGCSIEEYRTGVLRLKDQAVDALLPGHRLFCLNRGQRQLDHAARALSCMLLPKSVLVAY